MKKPPYRTLNRVTLGLALALVIGTFLIKGRAKSPIIEGTDDWVGNYLNVLSLSAENGSSPCSAVLIHPRLLLTAGHCIPVFKPIAAAKPTKPKRGVIAPAPAPAAPIPNWVLHSDQLTLRVPVTQMHAHPKAKPMGSVVQPADVPYDIGYVLLSEDLTDIEPARVGFNTVDWLRLSGNEVALVGFGVSTFDPSMSAMTLGRRRSALNRIDTIDASGWISVLGESHSIGPGDSGGAAFGRDDAGREALIAIAMGGTSGNPGDEATAYFSLLRKETLCWVQHDSKIPLGLDCGKTVPR